VTQWSWPWGDDLSSESAHIQFTSTTSSGRQKIISSKENLSHTPNINRETSDVSIKFLAVRDSSPFDPMQQRGRSHVNMVFISSRDLHDDVFDILSRLCADGVIVRLIDWISTTLANENIQSSCVALFPPLIPQIWSNVRKRVGIYGNIYSGAHLTAIKLELFLCLFTPSCYCLFDLTILHSHKSGTVLAFENSIIGTLLDIYFPTAYFVHQLC
jgi:hypothetical protein